MGALIKTLFWAIILTIIYMVLLRGCGEVISDYIIYYGY